MENQQPERPRYGSALEEPGYFDMKTALSELSADADPRLIEILRRLHGRLEFTENVVRRRVIHGR